jgi:predicted house-cleaning NTP pyrophosphatase (Maf/HAM1 superfamily)
MESRYNIEGGALDAEALIESWKTGPVILASSSWYRRRELENLGFEHVTTIPVPNDIEQQEFRAIVKTEGKNGTRFDPYKTEIPNRIARVKVSHILAHEAVSPETLVVALDTLPMVFTYNDDNTVGSAVVQKSTSTMWSAEHATKPESLEEAREAIKDTFTKVSLGYRRYIESTAKLYNSHGDEETQESLKETFDNGYLPMLVRVNTGIAIRFPNQSDIKLSSSYINLKLQKVFELADKPDELDKLVEETLQTMQNSNKQPTDIAGGIDYSNQEIIDLLKIEESNLFGMLTNERGVYKGFPTMAFEQMLKMEAELK